MHTVIQVPADNLAQNSIAALSLLQPMPRVRIKAGQRSPRQQLCEILIYARHYGPYPFKDR